MIDRFILQAQSNSRRNIKKWYTIISKMYATKAEN